MTPPFRPLRILITNVRLDGRSGTEIVTRNLAIGLKMAGHLPMVYSPHLGPIADELRSLGIAVSSRIDQIRVTPDVIHGHHVLETGVAATRFPHVPGIFVCHDFTAWHDEAARLNNIVHFVAVGDATRDRLTIEDGIAPSCVSMIENATDMHRFQPGPPPPDQPRNALVMLKGAAQLGPIEAACQARGIRLDVAGAATGLLHERPEELFPRYDLVFASGLTAIEAMACLRPVVLCDHRGLAGFVDTNRYAEWRSQNFGLRSLTRPLTEQALLAEIDSLSAAEALNVGQQVRRECALEPWIDRYLILYRQCIDQFAREKADDFSASIATHMEKWCSATSASRTREATLNAPTRLTELTGLIPLIPGDRTTVNDNRRVSVSGFHGPEPWGRWTASPHAVLTVVRTGASPPQWLQIEYVPYLSRSITTRQTLCSINGQPATTWIDHMDDEGGMRRRCVPIGEALQETGALFVSFDTLHGASPQDEGTGADKRPLGVGIVAVTLLDHAPTPAPLNDKVTPQENRDGLCTIVLSHRNPASLTEAVRSLLAQQPAEDVVVINSGGGDAQSTLKRAGINVRVVERESRLFPGGARNLGLTETHQRYVAFLASDCIARPGWVKERLAAHQEGHSAVASALLCHRPRHPVALAAHLTLFCRRMPRTPAALALCYGASYDRQLFHQHGLFREDIEGGEDTDFHSRLEPAQRPVWRPSIQTIHCGPSTLRGFLSDQYKRGQRASTAWQVMAGRSRRSFALGILGRIASTLRTSVRVAEPGHLPSTLLALPLIAVGGVVYAAGALSGAPKKDTNPNTGHSPQEASR